MYSDYELILSTPFVAFSSRYFHWKLNLCVILLVLVFMVPFYIGYFVVSNIRLCKYSQGYLVKNLGFFVCHPSPSKWLLNVPVFSFLLFLFNSTQT